MGNYDSLLDTTELDKLRKKAGLRPYLEMASEAPARYSQLSSYSQLPNYSGLGETAGTGATIGSLFGPVGTAIGAGAGLLLGTVGKIITGNEEEEARKRQEAFQREQFEWQKANSAMADRRSDRALNQSGYNMFTDNINNAINTFRTGLYRSL